jgi:hypothetical protein
MTLDRLISAATPLYYEARISDSLGVSRKTLAKMRTDHLAEGTDYLYRENHSVALTAAGMEKIDKILADPAQARLYRLPPGKPTGNPGKPAANGHAADDVPAGPPPREWMRVERVPQNTGLLLCVPKDRPPADRLLVSVRVRENANFAAGMELEAIRSADGVWQFRNRPLGDESTVGRLPRQKGRW